MLIIVLFILGLYVVYYIYSMFYWLLFGILIEMISLFWGIVVVVEICMFFFVKCFLGKVKIYYLMMVVVVVIIFCWILLVNIINLILFIFE